VDDGASEQTKARYKFPFGDFEKVHRCGLLAAEVRAGQRKYRDIEDAAIRLREMIEWRAAAVSQAGDVAARCLPAD
jgi:hypothetical protein